MHIFVPIYFSEGRGTIRTTEFLFSQSILSDRYLHCRDLGVVSIEITSRKKMSKKDFFKKKSNTALGFRVLELSEQLTDFQFLFKFSLILR